MGVGKIKSKVTNKLASSDALRGGTTYLNVRCGRLGEEDARWILSIWKWPTVATEFVFVCNSNQARSQVNRCLLPSQPLPGLAARMNFSSPATAQSVERTPKGALKVDRGCALRWG